MWVDIPKRKEIWTGKVLIITMGMTFFAGFEVKTGNAGDELLNF
jgi:hypothetical protein